MYSLFDKSNSRSSIRCALFFVVKWFYFDLCICAIRRCSHRNQFTQTLAAECSQSSSVHSLLNYAFIYKWKLFIAKKTLFTLSNINMMCKVPCMLSKHLFVFNLGTCCFHFFENSLSFIHLFACSVHCCCHRRRCCCCCCTFEKQSRFEANSKHNKCCYLSKLLELKH